MSTIDDVKVAEKKLQEILDTIQDAPMHDLNRLSTELQNACDEYASAVRELKL